MTKPIETLMNEHKNIMKVITALSKECDALQSGKEVDREFIGKVIYFVRNYADKFHHAKEEDILFKELRKNPGKMHCDPTEQMEFEHDLGRNFVKLMEEGLNESDKEKLMRNAKEYVQLLTEHIFKEDNILFPMADNAMDEKTQKLMAGKFKEVEKKKSDEKKKCLSFVKELENREER